MKEYYEYCVALVQDISKIASCSDLSQGNSAAFLLALCYIEGIGKFIYYDTNEFPSSNPPNSKAIFCKVLKNEANISDETAKKIYSQFRCGNVHSLPTPQCITIRNENGNNVTIDIEWCVNLFELFISKTKNAY